MSQEEVVRPRTGGDTRYTRIGYTRARVDRCVTRLRSLYRRGPAPQIMQRCGSDRGDHMAVPLYLPSLPARARARASVTPCVPPLPARPPPHGYARIYLPRFVASAGEEDRDAPTAIRARETRPPPSLSGSAQFHSRLIADSRVL